jgi:hypothetical protein
MITGSGYISKAVQSLHYYLRTAQYNKDATTKTLLTEFDNLDIVPGFPDTLEKLSLPTLSIMTNPISSQISTFNSSIKTITLSFSIYGFCGGMQTDNDNLELRDSLCNDVRELLEDTDYITLYEYPDFSTSKGDMSIESVESRFIEPMGSTSAERFRFVIDLECEYSKNVIV